MSTPVRYRIGNRASKGLYAHSTYRVSRRVIIYYGVSPRPAYSVILELGFSPSRIGIPSRNSFERRDATVTVSVTVSVPVQRRRLGAPSAASRAVRGVRSRSGPASSAARVGRGATERFRAVSVPRTGATRTRATRYGRARMRHAWSTRRLERDVYSVRPTYVTPCASPAPRAWYRSRY